jgi:periplasmic divalent cation tolerance protein
MATNASLYAFSLKFRSGWRVRGTSRPMAVIAVITNLPDSESLSIWRGFSSKARPGRLRQRTGARDLFFRWQGRMEEAPEVPVILKTTAERYPELERALRELHPYDLPEILAFDARGTYGLPGVGRARMQGSFGRFSHHEAVPGPCRRLRLPLSSRPGRVPG